MKKFFLSFIQKITLYLSVLICIGQISNLCAQPNNYYFCGNGFAGSQWTCLGQNPTPNDYHDIGIIQSIAVHPSNTSIIYAGGGRYGGLWKTTNGGVSWVNKTDVLGVATLGITAVAIHPSDQNIVLAGTQTRAYEWGYYEQGIGVIKSIDGGNTWQTTNIALFPKREKNINVIRFHPTNPNIVLAAGNVFIYKSTNAGTTWSVVDSIPYQRVGSSGPGFIDIEFLPSNPNIVLASTDRRGLLSACQSALLFLSTNAGSNWSDVTPSDAYVAGQWGASAIAIDVTPADPNNIYIMYQNANTPTAKLCIKKSPNGVSWTQTAQCNSFGGWGSWNKFQFEVSNTNLNTIYAGGLTMHKSVNGGNTWTEISDYCPDYTGTPLNSTHADVRALIQLPSISGDYLIMGDDGGISKTMNGGSSWYNLTGSGLVISECYAVGALNSNNNLVVGLQDNSTKMYNSSTNQWINLPMCTDGGWVEVDYTDDKIVYISDWDRIWKYNPSLPYSTQNPPNPVSINVPDVVKGLWRRFQIDPTNHNKLWRGITKLHVYDNSTNTWSLKHDFGSTISAIHVAPSNGNVMYVAMSDITWGAPVTNKLFKSIDGGNTFSDISASCNAYKWANINDFCIDPYNHNRIWAGCGMYWKSNNNPSDPQGQNRVIYSNNGGTTWTDISTGLPPFPVYYLIYREGSDDEIYAGIEGGIYRWNKALQKWECFNNGFPPAFVTKLEINNCNNTIVASTFGRGVWKATLPPLPVSTYTVSSTQTWDENSVKSFASDIVVSCGVTLTVKGVVKMAHKRRITIKPGGKLIVDGGKITNSCPDKLWNGILVSGNINLPQTSQNQGTVELKNGAIIENSRNAISTGDYLPNGSYDWNSHGGIIYASNATFINNQRAIEFMSYPPSGSSLVSQNVSYFNNCNFIVDDNNMFANDNAVFANHFTMWAVSGVQLKGCTFENNITTTSDRGKAIYSVDAGYKIDEYCTSSYSIATCMCKAAYNPSQFNRFETAIESSNSVKQYAITIDRSNFDNNIIGVRLDGKNSFQLSRLNMNFSPIPGRYPSGIYLDNCTNYKVEDNQINSNNIAYSSGIWVNCPGIDENKIYKNKIKNSYYGLRVTDFSSSTSRGYLLTGLQFICNNLNADNMNDVIVSNGGEIRYLQGSQNSGADNWFTKPHKTYNFSLHSQHTPIIYCYDFSNPAKQPTSVTNNIAFLNAPTNSCVQTLCNYEVRDIAIIEELIGNPDKSGKPALEKYILADNLYNELKIIYYQKGYDKILKDYYAGVLENEELFKEAINFLNVISTISDYMADLSKEELLFLKNDSVAIDLLRIKDWYNAINTISAKYSLAETYFQLDKFEEGLKTLELIPENFNLNENEMIEHLNYVSLYIFNNKIRESGKTIAQLDGEEIEQMLYFANASRGLSSVMAQGVLCFFYDICFEIKTEEDILNQDKGYNGENGNESKSNMSTKNSNSKLENVTIYPNPTTGELVIVSEDIKIDRIEVLDIVGKIVSNHLVTSSTRCKINISNLNPGIYFIKIATNMGEVVKKVVKQ